MMDPFRLGSYAPLATCGQNHTCMQPPMSTQVLYAGETAISLANSCSHWPLHAALFHPHAATGACEPSLTLCCVLVDYFEQ